MLNTDIILLNCWKLHYSKLAKLTRLLKNPLQQLVACLTILMQWLLPRTLVDNQFLISFLITTFNMNHKCWWFMFTHIKILINTGFALRILNKNCIFAQCAPPSVCLKCFRCCFRICAIVRNATRRQGKVEHKSAHAVQFFGISWIHSVLFVPFSWKW